MPRPLRLVTLVGVLPGVVLAVCQAASAQTTLFQYTTSTVGEVGGRVETVSFPINYLNRFDTTLFEQFSFTGADVGRTVTATRATDASSTRSPRCSRTGRTRRSRSTFTPPPT